MKPCTHNGPKRDLWHYPKDSPALELARLCGDCIARERGVGVKFFTADGAPVMAWPLLSTIRPPPMEAPVPRSKPVEITCADCGKTARLKAFGRCSRCYDIDRRRKAAAAMAAADKAGPRPPPTARPLPPAPESFEPIRFVVGAPSLPSLGERALAALLLLHCESLGAVGNAPRVRTMLEAVLDGRDVLGAR